MQDFQQRVVDEKQGLDDKLGRLLVFLGTEAYYKLPTAEQARLNEQSLCMKRYSAILAERIANFAVG